MVDMEWLSYYGASLRRDLKISVRIVKLYPLRDFEPVKEQQKGEKLVCAFRCHVDQSCNLILKGL